MLSSMAARNASRGGANKPPSFATQARRAVDRTARHRVPASHRPHDPRRAAHASPRRCPAAHAQVLSFAATAWWTHGGPGIDHSRYRDFFSGFADVAQVVYLDHRGNGRSDAGPRERWRLEQWGDDVAAFCEALEIQKPIVMGESFGGMVALAYAVRHPEGPGKLVLCSTAARIDLDDAGGVRTP